MFPTLIFEVWSDVDDWRGRLASPERRRGEEMWGGRVASPTREVSRLGMVMVVRKSKGHLLFKFDLDKQWYRKH